MQAQLDDPSVAEWILQQPEAGPYRPQVQEFTPEMAALYDIADRLGEVMAAVLVAGDRKAPKIRPMPRPVTAVERARARKETERHLSLVDEVLEAQKRWEANRREG